MEFWSRRVLYKLGCLYRWWQVYLQKKNLEKIPWNQNITITSIMLTSFTYPLDSHGQSFLCGKRHCYVQCQIWACRPCSSGERTGRWWLWRPPRFLMLPSIPIYRLRWNRWFQFWAEVFWLGKILVRQQRLPVFLPLLKKRKKNREFKILKKRKIRGIKICITRWWWW